jgi:hypothetical protein
MTPATAHRAFRRGDPVLDYWLGNCEGFAVASPAGRTRGVVEEVLRDERGSARALVVRTGLRDRRRVIDAQVIDAVTPALGTIELGVRSRRPPRSRHVRAGLERLGDTGVRAAGTAGSLGLAGTRWGAGRARRHGPVVAARTAAAGARTAAAARAAASWTRPRAVAVARHAVFAALTAAILLAGALRSVLAVARAYGSLLAREVGRRREAES